MAEAISRRKWGARGIVPRESGPKTELLFHHSADANRDYTPAEERAKVREIEKLHMTPGGPLGPQGGATVAYSWLIFPSGNEYVGRGFTGYVAANGHNNNRGTWAVCFIGDYRRKKLTPAQVKTADRRTKLLKQRGLKRVGGHKDVFGTECPGAQGMKHVSHTAKKFKLRRI